MLNVTDGSWTGNPAPTFAYQWQRDSVDIAGAVATSYTLVATDDRASIRCVVTATNSEGSSAAPSNGLSVTFTAPVAAGALPDQNYTSGVVIAPLDVSGDFTGTQISYVLAPTSGALPIGLALTTAGVLSGTPTEEITGLAINVRGSNSGGFAESGFAITVSAALAAPVNTTAPAVSGTPEVGQALRCHRRDLDWQPDSNIYLSMAAECRRYRGRIGFIVHAGRCRRRRKRSLRSYGQQLTRRGCREFELVFWERTRRRQRTGGLLRPIAYTGQR